MAWSCNSIAASAWAPVFNYKMEPGYTTIPHEHRGNEEFFIISGDITDNDGTVYREGDLVLMKNGTQHCSYTENGCVIAVFIEASEASL